MGKTFNFKKISQDLILDLSPKQKEVILRRFGLQGQEPETLQAIGDSYRITRERVRQIEEKAFEKIKPRANLVKSAFENFAGYIKEQGGIKREDILLNDLGGKNFQNEVYFLLTMGDEFFRFPANPNFYPFWSLNQDAKNHFQKVNTSLIKLFEKEGKPLGLPEIIGYSENLNIAEKKPEIILSYLEISRAVEQGFESKFGLTIWPEIKPRGIGDLSYLALRKKGQPLHFSEIASQIEKLEFPKRRVLLQTVHNELIRDQRFVLVGKGMYALKEWGYLPGTVQDVLVIILNEAKEPLGKKEILEKLKTQRIVKNTTVYQNLENKNYFQKNSQGRYFLA